MSDREIDPGIHFALAALLAVQRTWSAYPHEFAKIMQDILDLERRHHAEGGQNDN